MLLFRVDSPRTRKEGAFQTRSGESLVIHFGAKPHLVRPTPRLVLTDTLNLPCTQFLLPSQVKAAK